MIKLVIFDLWKTLVYRDVPYSTVSKILELTGSKIPREKFVKIFENALQTTEWKSKKKAYAHLAREMGLEDNEHNVKLLMNVRETAEKKFKLFPHTIDMLDKLKKKGLKLGMISNSSVFGVQKIKKGTNLFDFFDYVVLPYHAGVVKPEPGIYLKMLEISEVKPKEALMIGDNPVEDVEVPRSLGINAILFTDYEQLKKDLKKFKIVI